MKPAVSLTIILISALAVAISFGIRTTFGVFVPVLNSELGWSVSALALGWAVQNLVWGALQPVAGAIADARGPRGVVFFGGLCYALGLLVMAFAPSALIYGLGSGVLVGIALAFGGMGMLASAVMRVTPPEKRGLYGGIVTAGGSIGQFTLLPTTGVLLSTHGWHYTLLILSFCATGIALCAFALPKADAVKSSMSKAAGEEYDTQPISTLAVLRRAFETPSYLLLISGFFVCGFHIGFMSFHLPQFAALCGLEPKAATDALALVGFFNMFGCILSGALMNRAPSKYILSSIYFGRAILIATFFLLPVTDLSIRVFGVGLGLLWLATLPPTTGIVAQIFGPRHMTMLYGVVYFGHQIGAFIGAYMAGWLYDKTGNYDITWWMSIGLAIFAGIIHLPIQTRQGRTRLASQPA